MFWFARLSLRTRILTIVAFACSLSACVAITGFLYFTRQELEQGIVNKERTVHAQLAAAAAYVAEQGGLPGVIAKYAAKYKDPSALSAGEREEIMKQVPIVAALRIGAKNAPLDHYEFRVFSDEPRRKENAATPAEREIFRQFEQNAQLEEQITNDGHRITVYRPVRLAERQGCLHCHGNPAESPWKNGQDILGFRMENWADGKLHGVFAVSQVTSEVQAAASSGRLLSPSGWLVGGIVLGALFAMVLASLLARGTVQSLQQAAGLLRAVSATVNTSSAEIASAATGLSTASSQQAASLQQTSAAIEEVSAMVAQNSDNARRSAEVSAGAQAQAGRGRQVVSRMNGAMGEINQSNGAIVNQVNSSNEQISEIVRIIQDIGAKTKVINDIVFQTKLLSFNASVEAARAGEHGKGFAVVAEEVGKLAQMSGNAAEEISSMLAGSIHRVEAIVQDTKVRVESLVAAGREKVELGSAVAAECEEVLEEIVSNVESVSRLAKEISVASEEQSRGVQEVNVAVGQLDQVTQQNSETSQRTAGAADELARQAGALESVVGRLLAAVEGGAFPTSAPPPAPPAASARPRLQSSPRAAPPAARRQK